MRIEYYKTRAGVAIIMKRVVGFALFWVAVGIILAMILPNTFVEVLCIALCILAGDNLFCC